MKGEILKKKGSFAVLIVIQPFYDTRKYEVDKEARILKELLYHIELEN